MGQETLLNCLDECLRAGGNVPVNVSRLYYDKYDRCQKDCLQNEYDAPMLWVGLYIAAASLVCLMAFVIDLVNGFRAKKLWFPCKFFGLNAAISAVIAIALKIPSDLTTSMSSGCEQLMKVSGTALLSVSLANFMPSLASMSDSELFSNLMALALLIVPIIGNICIQIVTRLIAQQLRTQHVIILLCILLQFILLISTALASPTMKIELNSAYKEATSTEASLIRKYWVMTQTSNPQFVISRSVICIASGAICFVTVIILTLTAFEILLIMSFAPQSDYKWSGYAIVVVQFVAILSGSISPMYRWFNAVRYKCEEWLKTSFTDLWKVEGYWTERLRQLKESWSRSNCRLLKLTKFNQKALLLDICIKFQIFTVITCNFLSFISFLIFFPLIWFYIMMATFLLNIFKKKTTEDIEKERDLKWEIRLENEPEFPKETIKEIVSISDDYIKKGKKKTDSMKLIKPLNKDDRFDGIQKFNLTFIQRLTEITVDGVPNNPNGSWTMMVVTLSTIALACSNKTRESNNEFVHMVSNVLPYVIYVDEIVGVSSKVDNIIDLVDAAMILWFDIHYFKRWLNNINLPIIQTVQNNSLKENLTILRDSSKNYIENTTTTGGDKLRVTTAEWMNETVEIVLQFLENGNDDHLFDKISEMVADILSACLVNLSKAITIKISHTPIEKREDVVKHAACIFGETQKLQKIVEERLSSVQNHKEYVEASWWKVVINNLSTEDTIINSQVLSHVSTSDHIIDMLLAEDTIIDSQVSHVSTSDHIIDMLPTEDTIIDSCCQLKTQS